jgi:hypothetical protein
VFLQPGATRFASLTLAPGFRISRLWRWLVLHSGS